MKRIDAKDQNLPMQKVKRVEQLGGFLKYISDDYFVFIQRMEYVFMNESAHTRKASYHRI